MKRTGFWLALLWCLATQAQRKDTTGFEGFKPVRTIPHQNLVKTFPLPFLVGQIMYCGEARFTYERMITHNQSVLVGVSYNYPNLLLLLNDVLYQSGFSRFNIHGARGMLGYRIYPFRTSVAPEGPFAGVYMSYNYARVRERSGNGDFFALHYTNASVVGGYQMYLGDNFYGEGFAGIGYRYNFVQSYDASTGRTSLREISTIPVFKNLKFVLQFNVSYAF
ncbi:MAG: hypothetical protein NZM35_08620 [Chitinophagales bacterium]|nr:hypothetical protein [Chitinophagales bacterium]MDW8419232.1 hypothetical protein [Chitinophagales bacterium]